MSLPELLAGVELAPGLADEIAMLRDLKSTTNELGLGPRRAAIDHFAQDRMQWGQSMLASLPADDDERTAETANALFRRLIGAP